MTDNATAEFSSAIQAAGMGAIHPIGDSDLHRFRTVDDKPGQKSGWYVLHLDGRPAGSFGNWKTGISSTWSMGSTTGRSDRAVYQRIKVEKQQREHARHALQAEAAARAADLWKRSRQTAWHPYMMRKCLGNGPMRQLDERLLVPVHNPDGQLVSLQIIGPDGSKRFLRGGRVKDCYCPIGDLADPVLIHICEGYATGLTLRHHHPVRPAVLVAFNAGNLEAVAIIARATWPNAEIVIAADNDHQTEGNPGLTKARKAAAEIQAKVIYPVFDGMDGAGTDFNDYVLAGGDL